MPAVSAAELKKIGFSTVSNLIIEPVHGCLLQCKQCTFGDIPTKRQFMVLEKLDKQLSELKHSGLVSSSSAAIGYSGRGNPFDHANLASITAVVRKHFPDAGVSSFWSLAGVPSRQELFRRTEGLDELIISMDAHHFSGLLKLDRDHPIDGKAHGTQRERVWNSQFEKLAWAVQAAKKNGFSIRVRLTGKERERKLFENDPVSKKSLKIPK